MNLISFTSKEAFQKAVLQYKFPEKIPFYLEHEVRQLNSISNFSLSKLNFINQLDSENIIVTVGDEFVDYMGILASKLFQREFYNFKELSSMFIWLENITVRVKSIMFIISPQYMNAQNQLDLIRAFQKGGPFGAIDIPFGIITGKTMTLLQYHLLKNFWLQYDVDMDDKHMLFHSLQKETIIDDNIINVAVKEASIKNISEFSSKDMIGSLALTSGSMDDFTTTSHEVICGKNDFKLYDNNRPKPQCEYGCGCMFDRLPQQPASSVMAKIVFVQGCNTSRFLDSDFGLDYDIGYAFLESKVVAYIASPRIVSSSQETAIFFSYLLGSGYKLGETIKIINNCKIFEGQETPSYILYGDPKIHFLSQNNKIKKEKIKLDSLDKKHQFSIDVDSYQKIIEITMESLELQECYKNKNIELEIEGFDLDYLVFFEEVQGGVKAYIVLRYNETEKTIRITLDLKKIQYIKNQLDRLINNIYFEKYLGNSIYANKNIIQNLNNKLQYISKSLYGIRNGKVKDQSRYNETFNLINQDVKEIGKETVNKLLNKVRKSGYLYEDLLTKHTYMSDCITDRDICDSCNNITSTRVKQHHILEKLQRSISICPVCSNIFEQPSNAPLEIKIEADRFMRTNDENVLKIKIKNISESITNITMGCELTYGALKGKYSITNQLVNVVLLPQENYICEIKLNFEDLPPYLHKISIIIFSDFDLYTIVHNFYATRRVDLLNEPASSNA